MRLLAQLAKISPSSFKLFAKKRLPIYAVILLVLIMFGVKGLMITFGIALAFFLGWTLKGMFQAFHDWRLTQRLNRVHFSAIDYDTMQRENQLLHDALNAFKDNGKRFGGAGGRNDPQPSQPTRAKMNNDDIREMIIQMGGEIK